ncbi:hypothetical protein [Moheibacter stercoris]|uniref:Tetratricopeptide (TPR) repeat protein n=1 Tax=Moheibacter stercoris TaxID=1628251 RepID=A0ABV2LSX7_9FLAO
MEISKAIDERDLSGAKLLLEELLSIDPGYGRAHNHLGWIYETKIKDFQKAQRHYELAIKFCQGTYPVVYVNYGYLLIEFGHLEEAEKVIAEGLTVDGADKATLYYQKAKIAEHRKDYIKAYKTYLEAKNLNFNKDFHGLLLNEIGRVQMKMNFWQKNFKWLF